MSRSGFQQYKEWLKDTIRIDTSAHLSKDAPSPITIVSVVGDEESITSSGRRIVTKVIRPCTSLRVLPPRIDSVHSGDPHLNT